MARILVAEDDPDIFHLVQFRLRHAGHEVTNAPNGIETLAQARAERPDLLLLDVMMPLCDGFQVLTELRADPAMQGLPIIMLTTHGQEAAIVKGIQGGANDYIVKPFSFPELLKRIDEVLARCRSESPGSKRLLACK